MDTSGMAFPRPSDIEHEPIHVRIYPCGREVCSKLTAEGRREYKRRLTVAWEQQRGICPLCLRYVSLELATVDHIKPRKSGGSERDDRQENIQAMCWLCNSEKGSRRI